MSGSPLDVTAAGVILDGHARHQAALQLSLSHVPVRVLTIPETAEVEYLLKAAILRRHLTQSQKAALAVEHDRYHQLRAAARKRQHANLRHYAEVATLPPRGKTREIAAGWAGVSARTIQDAHTVKTHDPDLFDAVKHGRITVHTAARRVRRHRRDQALGPEPPLPVGPFELVYADPPWQLGNPDGAHAPENHYPTLTPPEIIARRPPLADNAVLFLWAVTCERHQAEQVIEAWGFEFKSEIVWDKQSPGPGNWVLHQHETLLIARKGGWSCPDPEDRSRSIVSAPRGRHSEKPEVFYELIERMYPAARKLEMYARQTRAGWVAWGNQLDQASADGGSDDHDHDHDRDDDGDEDGEAQS